MRSNRSSYCGILNSINMPRTQQYNLRYKYMRGNPNPKTDHLVKTQQAPKWNNLPTKAIRVPEIFLEEIESYGRSLDGQCSPFNAIISALDKLNSDEISQIKLAIESLSDTEFVEKDERPIVPQEPQLSEAEIAAYTAKFGFVPSKYQLAIADWILRGKGHGCCNSVAGSGKSTTLKIAAKTLEESGLRPSEIKICVFGKLNAQDLIRKFGQAWKESISTLHSAGFSLVKKELGIRSSYDIDVNGQKYKRIAQDLDLIAKRSNPVGRLKAEKIIGSDNDFLKLVDLVRLTNQQPTQETIQAIALHFEIDDVWQPDLIARWIEYCLRIGEEKAIKKECLDFTDQIWLPVKWRLNEAKWFRPYRFVLVDEAQDLNAAQLELAMILAGDKGRILAVGDPCQPTGTKVLVVCKRPRGRHAIVVEEVLIQNLNVGDTVYSYCANDGHFYSSAKVTGITKRPFEGELVVVELPSGQKSKYTPNHHCIASFAPFRNHYCVYLMQKGSQFRVGMSKITVGENRGSGPVARLKQENADALWILGFYATRDEAFIMEQAISGKFGLPQIVFNDVSIQTKGLIEQAWKFIGDNFDRAVTCLNYFGRDIRYPMFKSGRNWQQSLKRPMVVQASNLVDGCLMLPFSNKNKTYGQDWQQAVVSSEYYSGDVYSLDIEKYHTYVADGIVTHNCQAIMGFAGADSDSYTNIIRRTNAVELPLSICYRCPRSHIKLVKEIYPQIPIEPSPSAAEGSITQIDSSEVEKLIKLGDMVIGRKTAPLVSLCIRLISRGIKATVKGKDIGESLKKDLEDIAKIPGYSFEFFNDAIASYKQAKATQYQGLDNEEQMLENLKDKTQAIAAIYQSQPQARGIDDLKYYIDQLFSDENSPITLSTCHRAKGLEGDRIFIYKPDDMPMRWKNQQEWQLEQEQNLLYVALTRSKSELFIVGYPDWYTPPPEEELVIEF